MEETPQRRDGKIIERDIDKEMRTAYIDYAMSVIVSRALPDARDGLKPVHLCLLALIQKFLTFWLLCTS